jgi:two-component system phosphate regulon sensor histidine kinase PhoR
MNHRYLGKTILFGTIVLACLMLLQIYWFRKAFDVADKQFDHQVQVALKKVADSISRDSEVRRLSSNFFFVATESAVNNEALDDLLRREFLLRSLNLDYELGVYNSDDDTLVYGNYVHATKRQSQSEAPGEISLHDAEKNFAVYFPEKESHVFASLDVWILSTLILILMAGFFAYAIYSLLRERRFASLKTDFVNNMTHEFRTPVTNIGIAGEILKNKISSGDTLNVYVDILLRENEKLRNKIDQVLLGSSLDHAKKTPAFTTIDIHQIITDCAEAFKLKLEAREGNIHLQFNAANAFILGDRDLLMQALNNVIDNAEKYSPERPRIVVRTRDYNQGVGIEIVDEGIGIPETMTTKVFDKFFRIRSGDVYSVKGFGLGLSFVKDVVQTHRGKVTVLSQPERGTAVCIYLPGA